MPTFCDKEGTTWSIDFTIGAARRIKSELKIDLLKPMSEGQPGHLQLLGDLELLINSLWIVCRKQAEGQSITDQEFGERLGGDALGDATEALLEALLDFFRKSRRMHEAAIIHRTVEQMHRLMDRVATEINGEHVGRLCDAKLDESIRSFNETLDREIGGAKSTNSPASSGSTPTR